MPKKIPPPHSMHDNPLTRARIAKNMTIAEVAAHVGCAWWTIQRYEDCGYVRNLDYARTMSKLYGIPIKQLMGYEVMEGR